MDNKERVFVIGDVHGKYDIIHRFLQAGVLDNSTLIQVGDFGLGFNKGVEQNKMKKLSRALVKSSCNLLIIRGNHDLPSLWLDSKENQKFNQTYENITLLPDYYTKEINQKRILFVGGGVSIDRYWRVVGESYWPDEVVNSPRFTLSKHDILISHTCPSFFNIPTNDMTSDLIRNCHAHDSGLMGDLIKEREIMDHIVKETQVKTIYSGHFHRSTKQTVNNINYYGLDIDELAEIDFKT